MFVAVALPSQVFTWDRPVAVAVGGLKLLVPAPLLRFRESSVPKSPLVIVGLPAFLYHPMVRAPVVTKHTLVKYRPSCGPGMRLANVLHCSKDVALAIPTMV